MKRYMLFAGYKHFPSGGFDDFKGSFDTLPLAQTACTDGVLEERWNWWHIIDITTGDCVAVSAF